MKKKKSEYWIKAPTDTEAKLDRSARLLVVAEEMLKALKEIVKITDRNHKAWTRAKAVIAKAEGRDV